MERGDQKDPQKPSASVEVVKEMFAKILCLVLRIALIIQFNSEIGPLIKIVGKMADDFKNILIIYVVPSNDAAC